jgi:6-phosphogluconolactonase/glucosamine-6-phosphate isomerase/deaminase
LTGSAGDLGGIEIARGKAAMTIGLATICSNPDVVAIIMAAGEGKAKASQNYLSPCHSLWVLDIPGTSF